jgi:hypothetical protein
MAHHSHHDNSSPISTDEKRQLKRDLADLFRDRPSLDLGPTGQFPEGKMNDADEGEIRVAIGQKDGKVVIDFGSPVAWIGLTAEQAEDIASTLRQHAIECRLRRFT